MTVTYGFYNSVNGDRRYDATDFAEIFDGIIEDGVHKGVGDDFKVIATGGDTIAVGSGRAWFNHTWTLSDTAIPFTIDAAHPSLNRIDAIVLEVDSSDAIRANQIIYLRGTPAATPQRPALIRSDTVNQYALAYVFKALNTVGVAAANITNVVGTTETPYAVSKLLDRSVEPSIMRRGVVRGKYLGTSYTAAQQAAVANGSFEDLYLGDYWTIGGVNWRIVDFDYYYNVTRDKIKVHHLVVMPDSVLRNGAMNDSAAKQNKGAYYSADVRTKHLPPMLTKVLSCFPAARVLTFNVGLTNVMVPSGQGSVPGGTTVHTRSQLELPNQVMMFGHAAALPGATGSSTTMYQIEPGGQLALFRFAPWMVAIDGTAYFTRDVMNGTNWAAVSLYGLLSPSPAYAVQGLRPYFCLK